MSNLLLIQSFQQLIQQKTIEINKLKAEGVNVSKLHFKLNPIRKALKIIKEYPENITQGKDISHFPGIGKGIVGRIDEILANGHLEDNNLPIVNTDRDLLLKITGIGPSKASSLEKLGITFQKLKEELEKLDMKIENIPSNSILQNLTHHQLVGLKYFEDIESRIPRDEIVKLEEKLKKIIRELDPKLEVIICGSYRRENETSGDIDMLVLHPDMISDSDITESEIPFLKNIVEKLTLKNLLVDHLTHGGKTKYMGLGKLSKKSPARRVDIRFIPYQSKGAAMLYFTGSGEFNKVMRKNALKLGYTINEYGIYKCSKVGRKIVKGDLVPTETEKDIFKLVKMDYLEPVDRK